MIGLEGANPEENCFGFFNTVLFYVSLIKTWLHMLLVLLWHDKEGEQHRQLAETARAAAAPISDSLKLLLLSHQQLLLL